MRRRAAALVAVMLTLALAVGATAAGYGPLAPPSGDLEHAWTSDTARETAINHHPVGATADGDLVLAPVAVPAGADGPADATGTTTATAAPDGHGHDHSHTVAGGGPAAGDCALLSLSRTGHTEWAYTVPAANCSAHAVTEPTAGDLTGDGRREVAFGTTEEVVVVLAANGTERYRIPLSSYGYGRPTVGDLTDDPGNELVASDIRGSLVVASGEQVVWRASLNGTAYPSPVVDDVDGDGDSEALVATSRAVVAFDADGERAWTRAVPGWTLATGDVDADPAVEAFAAGTDEVVALDGEQGAVQWRRSFDGTPTVGTVADGDGDGRGELYVALNGGRLLALDARTGETEWTARVPTDGQRLTPQPVVGDLTGDGSLEAVGVTNDGGVAVVDAGSGARRATTTVDANLWTRATLSDLDRDGDEEVLLRLGNGRVRALDYAE
jgi:outer membrane protein assembly factor BamB